MPPAQGFSRPNYPFAQQSQQQPYNPSFPIPRRDDEADSDAGDHYSMNSSTTRLAGAPAFYEQSSGRFYPSLLPPPLNHPPLQAMRALKYMVVAMTLL
jgi:1,3-beta-glucan synthase